LIETASPTWNSIIFHYTDTLISCSFTWNPSSQTYILPLNLKYCSLLQSSPFLPHTLDYQQIWVSAFNPSSLNQIQSPYFNFSIMARNLFL
jgi:hypothetical protein